MTLLPKISVSFYWVIFLFSQGYAFSGQLNTIKFLHSVIYFTPTKLTTMNLRQTVVLYGPGSVVAPGMSGL